MPDSGYYILIRLFISICGTWVSYELVEKVNVDNTGGRIIKKLGNTTLELYVVHYFIVRIVDVSKYDISNIAGVAASFVLFVTVLCSTVILIIILNRSKVLKFILFGKNENGNI